MKMNRKSVIGTLIAVLLVSVMAIGTIVVNAQSPAEPTRPVWNVEVEVYDGDDVLAAVLNQNANIRMAQPFSMSDFESRLSAGRTGGAAVVSSGSNFCTDCCVHKGVAVPSNSSDIDLQRIIADIENGLIQATTERDVLNMFPGASVQRLEFTVANETKLFTFGGNTGYERVIPHGCPHDWALGVFSIHALFADGSCTIEFWDAVLCLRCGELWLLSFISSTNSRVCPH